MPGASAFSLPFDEAMRYFLSKKIVTPSQFAAMDSALKQKAFTVAGLARDDMLRDIYDAIASGLGQGTGIEQFKKDFAGIIQKAGWDPTGGSAYRVSQIFDTNVAVSYAAGRYRQMRDPDVIKVRPLWRWVESTAINPRPEHQQFWNLILPHDDPFWGKFYPQSEWGCQCGIECLSEREAAEIEGQHKDSNHPVQSAAPDLPEPAVRLFNAQEWDF